MTAPGAATRLLLKESEVVLGRGRKWHQLTALSTDEVSGSFTVNKPERYASEPSGMKTSLSISNHRVAPPSRTKVIKDVEKGDWCSFGTETI